MRMFRKDEGFTLVELMVVVLIIGILVAIAIPVFNAANANARQKACYANQRTIEGSVQQYLAADPTNTWAAGGVGVLVPNYIKTAPLCPKEAALYHVSAAGIVDGDSGDAAAGWGVTVLPAHAHF